MSPWEQQWRHTAGHVGRLTCIYYAAQARTGGEPELERLSRLNADVDEAIARFQHTTPDPRQASLPGVAL